MREKNLHTVCELVRRPNIGDCFGNKYGNVLDSRRHLHPWLAAFAPSIKANRWRSTPKSRATWPAVKELGLDHIVVTSVNRDDLADGGADHFAKTVFWIKNFNPGIRVELLIPDFEGNLDALKTVVDSGSKF